MKKQLVFYIFTIKNKVSKMKIENYKNKILKFVLNCDSITYNDLNAIVNIM